MGLLNSTYIIELLGRLHEGPRVISAHSRFRWHCPDHRRPLPRSPRVEWYCCCFLGMMIEQPVSVGWPAPGVLALKGEMACILYLGDAQWALGIHFLFHIWCRVFAASESEVLGRSLGTAKTPLCERSPPEPSLSQSWSLSAWGQVHQWGIWKHHIHLFVTGCDRQVNANGFFF